MKHTSETKWVFNRGAWASAVKEKADEHGFEFVAAFIGVNPATVRQWARSGSTTEEFPYPTMTNFILFCQEFDVDPREMFMIEETGKREASETSVITLRLVNPDPEYIAQKYEALGYRVLKITVTNNEVVTVILGA